MVYYICSGFIFFLSFSLVHLETIVFGADLYDVFKNSFLFISMRDLRDAWANMCEILHDDQ